MTHEDFIAEVARRLEWTEEKVAGAIETILEVMSAELKMNNSVVIDDFGTLRTDIQPEYVLVDQEAQTRFLMPPAVEIVLEGFSPENEENSSPRVGFTADEVLYNEINNVFSQFEPTPLNEGVEFPGIPEVIFGKAEVESNASDYPQEEISYPSEHPISLPEEEPERLKKEPEKSEEELEKQELTVEKLVEEPRYRSRQTFRRNKKILSVWVPIAGGIAIVVASLFFFKEDGSRR